MLEISVIICTKNRPDMLAEALESAKNQSVDSSRYEVIIVDGSDNTKTKELVESYPSNFRYIQAQSEGIPKSRNEGIENANGQIIVFVDDDVVFNSDYLQIILDFFTNSEFKPDMIGGKTHIKFLSEKPDWLDGPLLGILSHSDFGDEPKPYDSHLKHVPITCNMAIKRECFDKVGSFSNILVDLDKNPHMSEDVILANALRNLGCNLVYCPKMEVWHKTPEQRTTYKYFKRRFHLQGSADAYFHYMFNQYKYRDIPKKVCIHINRVLESLILRHIQKIPHEKYYQKLRLYYNSGYIKGLIKVLLTRKEIDENS